MKPKSNKYLFFIGLIILIAALLYISLFSDRYHFISLIVPYLVAFGAYLLIFNRIKANTGQILAVTALLRLCTFFNEPNLSTDYFRFLWDGNIAIENPTMVFSQTPRQHLGMGNPANGNNQILFDQLNSQEYFSVYPPVCQIIWSATSLLANHDTEQFVLYLRLSMFLFEIGSVFLILLILQKLKKPIELALLYALNPLVIIEITGNLHPEGFMIFFLSAAFYFLISFIQATKEEASTVLISPTTKWTYFALSSFCFGLAISTKLIPLMFLPLLLPHLGWWRSIGYSALAIGLTLVLFVPFLTVEWIMNIGKSLDLYFRQFEFNASIYYVLREVSTNIRGYNEIDFIGPILALCTVIYISIRSLLPNFRQPLFLSLLLASCVHLIFSTTVHPWYLVLPIFLTVFTERRFAIYWSFLILLSYTHYGPGVWREKYLLIAIEYSLLFLFIFIEKSFSTRLRPESTPL